MAPNNTAKSPISGNQGGTRGMAKNASFQYPPVKSGGAPMYPNPPGPASGKKFPNFNQTGGKGGK